MLGRFELQRVKLTALVVAVLLASIALACGSEADPTAMAPPLPTSTTASAVAVPATPEPETVVEGHQPTPPPAVTAEPAAPSESQETAYTPAREGEELNAILATTVLETGPQRVAFLLTTQTGLVKDSSVMFTPVYLPDNRPGDEVATRFNEWPYGTRGTFVAEVDFDRAGTWRLDIAAEGADATGWAAPEFEVLEASPVPALGAQAPLSDNKTLPTELLASAPDPASNPELYDEFIREVLAPITTDYSPDESLYRITVREAVEGALPTVVVFASPAFCTTATCGPQVDTVSELRAKYDGQANFIHVEIYDNPDEIQGDLTKARISPVVDEWGLSQLPHWFNESWTFVLDSDGRVQARFEGFATLTELEESLLATFN